MGRFGRQLGMGKEPEDAEAIVHGQGHEALAGHASALIARLRAVASHEAAAVEIDEHRKTPVAHLGWRPDIQVEAVLAHPVRPKVHVAEDGALHGARAELDGLTHALPVLDGLRRLPPQVSDGRFSEGNSPEDANAILLRGPLDGAVLRLDPLAGEGGDVELSWRARLRKSASR